MGQNEQGRQGNCLVGASYGTKRASMLRGMSRRSILRDKTSKEGKGTVSKEQPTGQNEQGKQGGCLVGASYGTKRVRKAREPSRRSSLRDKTSKENNGNVS